MGSRSSRSGVDACNGVAGTVCSPFEDGKDGDPSASSGLQVGRNDQELAPDSANTSARGQVSLFGEDVDMEESVRDPLVPRTLLRDSKISPEEKLLIIDLLSYCQPEIGNWTCWPSNGLLAEDLGCTDRSIRNKIEHLKSVGYIHQEVIKKYGRSVKAITLTIPYSPTWKDDENRKPTSGSTEVDFQNNGSVLPSNRKPTSCSTEADFLNDGSTLPQKAHSLSHIEELEEKTHDARKAAALPEEILPRQEGPKEIASQEGFRSRKPLRDVPARNESDSVPWKWMLDRWNEMVVRLGDGGGPRKIASWTDQRKKHAMARIDGGDPRQAWEAACALVEASPFLSRKCREAGTWRPDVDWMLTPGGWAKLHEGKYSEAREERDPDGGESTAEALQECRRRRAESQERMKSWGRIPRSDLTPVSAQLRPPQQISPAPTSRRLKFEDGPVEGDE